VVTQLGVVSYHRTYYASHSGGYCYPIDRVVGLESYQRVSSGVGLGLVEGAREMSYAKASRVVTGGLVTKQTVMQKIRKAVPAVEPVVRQKVAVLHVDADEDHAKLQTGDSRIVPLVSVYIEWFAWLSSFISAPQVGQHHLRCMFLTLGEELPAG